MFWRKQVKPPSSNSQCVWLHGASVGEITLLKPLVHRLVSNTDFAIMVTTYTSEGYQVAKGMFADNVAVHYLPFDFSWTMRAFFRLVSPRLVVLSELELWPNLLDEARRRRLPVHVANSRMNHLDYKSYKRVMFFLRKPLRAISWWGVQASTDAERIRSLIPDRSEIICVTGNMKYDSASFNACAGSKHEISREAWGYSTNDLLLIAGSTHAPEEAILIESLRELRQHCPSLYLILAPRKPLRACDIAQIAEDKGVSHRLSQSAYDCRKHQPAEVMIVNSVGLLKELWAIGDFAFVGGSLQTNHGGQNMLEPTAAGLPTCFGPNVFNFAAIVKDLIENDVACMVRCERELYLLLKQWIDTPEEANMLGRRARSFVQSQIGATDITYANILDAVRRS
ncbi:3-deoxy-D-manno-octulosonic acid transferase [Polystyrenella longa]|nr:glycosyltransferase N-terminal domain-containing protein [Polystyrenella longa]